MSNWPSWMEPDPRELFGEPLERDNPKIAPSRAELMREVGILQQALEELANRGTHADTNPTRRVPSCEEARKADGWWVAYLRRADENVRLRADRALREAGLR